MSSSSNFYVLGAGLLGVMGALSVILFDHFKQERRSRAMAQNLSRLDAQLSVMRAELEQIRSSQRVKKRELGHGKRSIPSTTKSHGPSSTDDYKSQSDADTSDLEYFDLSDEEQSRVSHHIQPPYLALKDVDQRLQNGDIEVIMETLTILDNMCSEYPNSPDLWYRLAKCCHHAAVHSVTPRTKRENINKGAYACSKALEYQNNNADIHKLYAILVGLRSDFEPTKQRIADGYLFKEHVDIAIRLNPTDATLHHMLGRFKYEIAGLKWFERKVATTLFGEPPTGTYDEALTSFLEAERLATYDWKENKMYIGKCYIALGEVRKGVDWLQQAYNIASDSQLDEHSLNAEIVQLLDKYKVYR